MKSTPKQSILFIALFLLFIPIGIFLSSLENDYSYLVVSAYGLGVVLFGVVLSRKNRIKNA